MSVVARRIRSTPVRSSNDTWSQIVDLLAPDKQSAAHKELQSVSGVSSSLITSEAMKDAPITCSGNGPRVRIYCLYDEAAILGEDANEAALQDCPTDGDWQLSLPCPTEDLDWVTKALKRQSTRITARDVAVRLGPTKDDNSDASSGAAQINVEAFLNS
jgi:hypothetical protein